jgi:HD-like signal output (HDOD) protein
MSQVLRGHQFLAIPFDHSTLKAVIERSAGTDYGMNSGLRELVGRIRTFPTIPSLYLEVVNALKDSNATTDRIGAIISKDMAMTTKLLQVINSSYFGLPRTITDPTEAIGILGFETVKSLIMTVKLLSQYDNVKPVYFSIDNIWRHSTSVARTARVITLLETGDNNRSGVAYTAGLMHDLGKVILAANFDGQYHGAHNIARKQKIPLWTVEKDIFGATHGEIGAYLLGLWGMSEEVTRVAALHHHPLYGGDNTFTALTAVHAANALEYEGSAEVDGLPVSVLDAAYLQELGLEQRVELWRSARHDPDAAAADSKGKRAKTTAKPAVKPADPALAPQNKETAPAKSSAGPTALPAFWKWLGIGLGAAAVLAFLIRLEFTRWESHVEKPEPVKVAETPPQAVNKEIAATASSAKPIQESKLAPVAAPATATNAAPGPAAQPPPLAASVPVPKPPAKPAAATNALDRLKLQAIFYNSQHPSALINGQLTSLDQDVAQCKVLDISPTSVTLEYLHQRKTLTLR